MRSGRRRRSRTPGVGLGLILLALPAVAGAQETLSIVSAETPAQEVEIARHRGYAALPAARLEGAIWSLEPHSTGWSLIIGESAIRLRVGVPIVEWQGTLIQLVEPPYEVGGVLYVPLQLVTDVLPDRLPALFASAGPFEVQVLDPGAIRPPPPPDDPPPVRVVIIDPGHGGVDPGAIGPTGVREKDVALAIARALAEELRLVEGIEVHLTRAGDDLVPLWKRGEDATRLKGERAGLFISIHTNALADRSVRGIETYFLSEARTEHERRVAALENRPVALVDTPEGSNGDDPDLGFILNELRNLDHQHWSADLAEVVQGRLAGVHPGPNRGVKQGPFAVITNALMPAVLVEAGFITHAREEALLADDDFQRVAAAEIALAVVAFFERYPPGPNGSPAPLR